MFNRIQALIQDFYMSVIFFVVKYRTHHHHHRRHHVNDIYTSKEKVLDGKFEEIIHGSPII